MIVKYQEAYYLLDKNLSNPNITAREVEFICNQQKNIAENVARFILSKNTTVEISNNKLLED